MELKLKKEIKVNDRLRSKPGLRAALLVAGLAILPSCVATQQKSAAPASHSAKMLGMRPDSDYNANFQRIQEWNAANAEKMRAGSLGREMQVAATIVNMGRKLCINPDMVESKLSETSRENGVGIKYRTETRAVKQGDSVKVQDSPGNELYVKVVKVTDEGVGFSFEDAKNSVWLIQYGEQRSIGEFVLRITIQAERCPEGDKALLVVTYPVGTADSKQDSPGSLVPRLPYRYGDAEHKKVQ